MPNFIENGFKMFRGATIKKNLFVCPKVSCLKAYILSIDIDTAYLDMLSLSSNVEFLNT